MHHPPFIDVIPGFEHWFCHSLSNLVVVGRATVLGLGKLYSKEPNSQIRTFLPSTSQS